MTFAVYQNQGGTVLLLWYACALAGAYVSKTKNRHALEGLLFGFFLGPIGLLIAAVLPMKGGAK